MAAARGTHLNPLQMWNRQYSSPGKTREFFEVSEDFVCGGSGWPLVVVVEGPLYTDYPPEIPLTRRMSSVLSGRMSAVANQCERSSTDDERDVFVDRVGGKVV